MATFGRYHVFSGPEPEEVMATRMTLAAACLLVLSTAMAPAQTMTSTPAQKKSLFCDLCKIQNCSCNSAGNACVGCGSGGSLTTAGGGGQTVNIRITRQMCQRAAGQFSRNACQFN